MNEVLIYETEDHRIAVNVRLDGETIWLNQEQMSQLFGRERSVITKHVRNVFREGELKAGSVCAKFAHALSAAGGYGAQPEPTGAHGPSFADRRKRTREQGSDDPLNT